MGRVYCKRKDLWENYNRDFCEVARQSGQHLPHKRGKENGFVHGEVNILQRK